MIVLPIHLGRAEIMWSPWLSHRLGIWDPAVAWVDPSQRTERIAYEREDTEKTLDS